MALAMVLMATILAGIASAYPSGIDRTLGLDNRGCYCHGVDDSSAGEPSSDIDITMEGVPEYYEPGTTYTVWVNLTLWGEDTPATPDNGTTVRGGFNLLVTDGSIRITNNMTQLRDDGSITHTLQGSYQHSWTFQWDAPEARDRHVDFYVYSNMVDGSGTTSGDLWNGVDIHVHGPDADPSDVTDRYDDVAIPLDRNLPAFALIGILLLVLYTGIRLDEDSRKAIPGILKEWVTTTDHKKIGILYLLMSILFLVMGLMLALTMRLQLVSPENDFLGPDQYNQIFTIHGTTMIFLMAMPMIFGIANYIVPLHIGARDLAFPRLNAFSFWLQPAGGLIIYSGILFGSLADVGWTGYAPYSSTGGGLSPGTELWTMGQILLGISSTITAVNFIVTILKMRAPGVKLMRMSLYTWSILITSVLMLFALPVLTVALVMLFMDRTMGTLFFDVAAGADPLLWEHLFWYFGHPEVYIVVLPAFGILSEVITTFSRRPLYGHNSMVYAMLGIGVLSFLVWGHHMYTSGADPTFRFVMMVMTMLVAVPTGIKVFNWLATLTGGSVVIKTPLLFALGCIATFTIGGVTGVMLASIPIDTHVHDTYFIVAHFHYTLIGGTVMAILAGLYYWYPKATGKMYNEDLGITHFVVGFISFHLTFFPMFDLGLLGMPRRVASYPAGYGFDTINLIVTIAGTVFALSFFIMLVNFITSLEKGKDAGDNPWGGWTFEWTISSPPPEHSFNEIPVLRTYDEYKADILAAAEAEEGSKDKTGKGAEETAGDDVPGSEDQGSDGKDPAEMKKEEVKE